MGISLGFFSFGLLLLCLGGGILALKGWKRRKWNLLRQGWKKRKMDQENLTEAIKSKREMETLVSTPGWKTLMHIAKGLASQRESEVLLKPTKDTYEQEYQKGEIQGIRLLSQYPEIIISNAQAVIELSMPKEEKTQE